MTWRILVHPDDVNLADAKAAAAELDTTVEGSPYVPRGTFLAVNETALTL